MIQDAITLLMAASKRLEAPPTMPRKAASNTNLVLDAITSVRVTHE